MSLPATSTAAIQLLRELADRIESGELVVSKIYTGLVPSEGIDPYTQVPIRTNLEIQTFVAPKKQDC